MMSDDFSSYREQITLTDNVKEKLASAENAYAEQLQRLRHKFKEVLASDDFWISEHDESMEWSQGKPEFHSRAFNAYVKDDNVSVFAFGVAILSTESKYPADYHIDEATESRIRDMITRMSQIRRASDILRATKDLSSKFDTLLA